MQNQSINNSTNKVILKNRTNRKRINRTVSRRTYKENNYTSLNNILKIAFDKSEKFRIALIVIYLMTSACLIYLGTWNITDIIMIILFIIHLVQIILNKFTN